MTTEQRIEKVKTLIASGAKVPDACKQVKVSTSSYYYHSAKARKPKRSRTAGAVIAVPQVSPKLMLIVGSPEELAQVMRSYT